MSIKTFVPIVKLLKNKNEGFILNQQLYHKVQMIASD